MIYVYIKKTIHSKNEIFVEYKLQKFMQFFNYSLEQFLNEQFTLVFKR